MAIRVGQVHVQYVAEPASPSDLRVTRVFAQVAVSSAAGATIKSVAHSMFASGPTLAFEDNFYFDVNMTLFDGASDNEWTYDPVYNVFVSQQLFGTAGDDTAEALYFPVAHTVFAGASSNQASPDAYREITQYLGFTDRHFEDVTQLLFTELEPGVVTIAEVVNVANFFFTDPANDNKVERAYVADMSLGFSSVIVQTFENEINMTLGLGETLDTSSNSYTQTTTQGGFLKQSIALSITGNNCREEEFAPIIGASDDESFDEMLTSAPALTDGDTLTLTYPFTSPTSTLILANPNFGNDDTFSFTRIDRRTRGGDRKIFTDPKWAKWERLELTIEGIGCNNDNTSTTLQDIIDFLNLTLGKEIGFADWEGRKWKGIIVAPETEIGESQLGKTLQLTFEGELTTREVQYGGLDVIHGQDTDGDDIDVIYNEE